MSYSELITETYYQRPKEFDNIEKLLNDIMADIRNLWKESNGNTLKFIKNNKYNFADPRIKQIEDLIKKVFGFRDINIEIPIYSRMGPYMFINVKYIFIGHRSYISYNKGYKATIESSLKGIKDVSNSIKANISIPYEFNPDITIKMQMASLLHEIGHAFDEEFQLMEIKKSTNLITIIKDCASKKSKGQITSKLGLFIKILGELLSGKSLRKAVGDTGSNEITKIGYGNLQNAQKHEFYADMLPVAYGYGKDLIKYLTFYDPLFKRIKSQHETDNIFNLIDELHHNLCYLSNIENNDVHSSTIHRMKMIIKQLELDLKDPKYKSYKKEIEKYIKELNGLLDEIIEQGELSEENIILLRAWYDYLQI